jgi:hypothetical protein
MSQPFVQVLVDFDIIDLGDNPFQLDDASNGILDTNELASSDLADLTSLVKSVSIDRGKSRQLGQFNAGTATVVFDNSSRILDPLNDDSVYYPNVLPRCGIQITANEIPIFYGLVVDWNLSYDITGQDIMTAVCSDDFTVLANQVLDGFTPSAELSGARINTVLARPEIEYLGTKQINAGSREMGDYAVDAGTNVLNYLQQVTKSEQGVLYTSANGVLTFKAINHIATLDPERKFSDDGDNIPYQSLLNQFGDELLYNYIITESPAGGPFAASDLTSQVRYQYQQLDLTDLLNSSDGVVESIGQQLLSKYKTPQLRWTGLSTQLVGLPLSLQNKCLQIDLTDICEISKTFATGSPSSAIQTVSVSGVNHQIVPGSHVVSFDFEVATPFVELSGAESDVTADGFRVVTWLSSGSMTVTGGPLPVEYLVVAGGGGGGGTGPGNAGGGGGGGLLTNVGSSTLIFGAQTVTVGAGGAVGGSQNAGSDGSSSAFGSVSTVGGGGGGAWNFGGVARSGRSGGSGGGAGQFDAVSSATGGAGTTGQGNKGGDRSPSNALGAAGGGGAGAVGGNTSGANGQQGGPGGVGLANSITGTSVTYAGGGGGSTHNTGTSAASGGSGGGGNGQFTPNAATAGTDGLGGGGGGGGETRAGGAGGDGVVIVRWAV